MSLFRSSLYHESFGYAFCLWSRICINKMMLIWVRHHIFLFFFFFFFFRFAHITSCCYCEEQEISFGSIYLVTETGNSFFFCSESKGFCGSVFWPHVELFFTKTKISCRLVTHLAQICTVFLFFSPYLLLERLQYKVPEVFCQTVYCVAERQRTVLSRTAL